MDFSTSTGFYFMRNAATEKIMFSTPLVIRMISFPKDQWKLELNLTFIPYANQITLENKRSFGFGFSSALLLRKDWSVSTNFYMFGKAGLTSGSTILGDNLYDNSTFSFFLDTGQEYAIRNWISLVATEGVFYSF